MSLRLFAPPLPEDPVKWTTWIATGLGAGYFPIVPGTAGSLVGFFLFLPVQHLSSSLSAPFLAILFGIGVYTAGRSESQFGKHDSGEIVIDEIVAMLVVLFLLPRSFRWWIAGFVFFRLFDMVKPPPIRTIERLHGGWGVMADDLGAAVYTIGLLRLVERFFLQ